MKRIFLLILLLISILLMFAAFAPIDNIAFPLKKINRTLTKLWKIQEIEIEQFAKINIVTSGSFSTLKNKGDLKGYLYVGRVNSCRVGGCEINNETLEPAFEYFEYFMIFDTNGVVQKIKIYNYQATHGHEVMSRGWLNQFVGYNGENKLRYGKDIEAISGATVSAKSLNEDVQLITQVLCENLKK